MDGKYLIQNLILTNNLFINYPVLLPTINFDLKSHKNVQNQTVIRRHVNRPLELNYTIKNLDSVIDITSMPHSLHSLS